MISGNYAYNTVVAVATAHALSVDRLSPIADRCDGNIMEMNARRRGFAYEL